MSACALECPTHRIARRANRGHRSNQCASVAAAGRRVFARASGRIALPHDGREHVAGGKSGAMKREGNAIGRMAWLAVAALSRAAELMPLPHHRVVTKACADYNEDPSSGGINI